MDANSFCDSMYSELTALRSRLYGIIREGEGMAGPEQANMQEWLTRMNGMVDDLNEKIDQLKRECPADWRQERAEVETARHKVNSEIDRWESQHYQDVHIGT